MIFVLNVYIMYALMYVHTIYHVHVAGGKFPTHWNAARRGAGHVQTIFRCEIEKWPFAVSLPPWLKAVPCVYTEVNKIHKPDGVLMMINRDKRWLTIYFNLSDFLRCTDVECSSHLTTQTWGETAIWIFSQLIRTTVAMFPDYPHEIHANKSLIPCVANEHGGSTKGGHSLGGPGGGAQEKSVRRAQEI